MDMSGCDAPTTPNPHGVILREVLISNPAETYERFMVPPLFAPFAKRLVDIAAPRDGDQALDVGCGTGVVARDGTWSRRFARI